MKMKRKKRTLIPRRLTKRKIEPTRPLSLAPDGEEIIVDWWTMAVGMSVFVPCLDFQQALDEFNYVCNNMDWQFEYVVRIEAGKIGVRFWRLS